MTGKQEAESLRAFLDSPAGERLLQWITDHQPKGLSDEESAAWWASFVGQIIRRVSARRKSN